MAGAGTHLQAAIKEYTGKEVELNCSCRAWIRKMDADHQWAKKNVNMITMHLWRQAKARLGDWKARPQGVFFHIPGAGMFLRPFIRNMVNEAIAKAETEING